VPHNLGKENSPMNSPTELQYLVLNLIFRVSDKLCAGSALFQDMKCNVFFFPRMGQCKSTVCVCGVNVAMSRKFRGALTRMNSFERAVSSGIVHKSSLKVAVQWPAVRSISSVCMYLLEYKVM
jgi:hypothetical protein